MMCLSKFLGATVAIALLAGSVAAADTVAGGKVKSINADDKTFVLTDSKDKDFSFKLGDATIVNRAGKEGTTELKVGDAISVCYDYEKGRKNWTVHYILVQEAGSKNCRLVRGTIKSYNADKKQMLFTGDGAKTSTTYEMGDAQVRLNMRDSKIEAIENGAHALLIVDTTADTTTLRSVMVDRK
jgi:hypothetical protein